MAFVKLDCNIVDSTLWVEREGREVFITALLMAVPREFTEPVPQIEVDRLEHTGFVAPAGWYGFVPASGPGILHRARVEDGPGRDALRMLGSPDPGSRSSDWEGRRMIRIDGGYLILNYIKYRDKDHTAAKRMQRYRERKRGKPSDAVTKQGDGVTLRNITQAEAYAEVEAEAKIKSKIKEKSTRARRAALTPMPDYFSLGVSERVQRWAEENGYTRLSEHLEHFVTVATARAYVYADWDAALMTAIRKDWAQLRTEAQRPQTSKNYRAASALQEMIHAERDNATSGNSRPNSAPALPRPSRPAGVRTPAGDGKGVGGNSGSDAGEQQRLAIGSEKDV